MRNFLMFVLHDMLLERPKKDGRLHVPCIGKMVAICKCFLKSKKARVQFVYFLINRIILLKQFQIIRFFFGLDTSAAVKILLHGFCKCITEIQDSMRVETILDKSDITKFTTTNIGHLVTQVKKKVFRVPRISPWMSPCRYFKITELYMGESLLYNTVCFCLSWESGEYSPYYTNYRKF